MCKVSGLPTKVVDEIGQMHFEGNIIPRTWYQNIKTEAGNSDFVAIAILSEVIYWYRPVEVLDEVSGKVTGFRKKFKADKWQRSTQSLADWFGFSKRQVKDALHRLKDAGLITTELRTVKTETGMVLSNVLFIEPVSDAIRRVTYQIAADEEKGCVHDTTATLVRPEVPPSDVQTYHPSTAERTTYTEIPTEIPTEIRTTGEVAAAAEETIPETREESPHPPLSSEKEEKIATTFQLYQDLIGGLNSLIAEKVRADIEDIPAEWIRPAFERAAEANVRRWDYVRGVLRAWKAKGSMDAPKQNGQAPPVEFRHEDWVRGQARAGEMLEQTFERLKVENVIPVNTVLRRREKGGLYE